VGDGSGRDGLRRPDRDAYRITAISPDGGRLVFGRPFESRRRDDMELGMLVADGRAAASAMGITFVPRDTPPCVERIDALPGGCVLVGHNRSESDLPPGVMRRCDLFDRDGCWVREVEFAHPEGDGVLDRLFFPAPGLAVLVRGGAPFVCRPGLRDDDPWPMETIVCRAAWPRSPGEDTAERPE